MHVFMIQTYDKKIKKYIYVYLFPSDMTDWCITWWMSNITLWSDNKLGHVKENNENDIKMTYLFDSYLKLDYPSLCFYCIFSL